MDLRFRIKGIGTPSNNSVPAIHDRSDKIRAVAASLEKIQNREKMKEGCRRAKQFQLNQHPANSDEIHYIRIGKLRIRFTPPNFLRHEKILVLRFNRRRS